VLESDHASVADGAPGRVGVSFLSRGRGSFPSFAGRGDVGRNAPRGGEEVDDFL
jgi:hypothetical protein